MTLQGPAPPSHLVRDCLHLEHKGGWSAQAGDDRILTVVSSLPHLPYPPLSQNPLCHTGRDVGMCAVESSAWARRKFR